MEPLLKAAQPSGKPGQQENPEMQQQVQLASLAAQKILFAPQTHGMFQQWLSIEDMTDAAAQTAFHVMMLLMQQTQYKMNPAVIPASGIFVVGEVMDFLSKARKQKYTQQDAIQAIGKFLVTLKSYMDKQAQSGQQAGG